MMAWKRNSRGWESRWLDTLDGQTSWSEQSGVPAGNYLTVCSHPGTGKSYPGRRTSGSPTPLGTRLRGYNNARTGNGLRNVASRPVRPILVRFALHEVPRRHHENAPLFSVAWLLPPLPVRQLWPWSGIFGQVEVILADHPGQFPFPDGLPPLRPAALRPAERSAPHPPPYNSRQLSHNAL